MIFSHFLSSSVLTGTGVSVFLHYFSRITLFNRLLWGVFFLTITLATFANILYFTGAESFRSLHHFLMLLSNTLGIVSMVSAVYALLHRQAISPIIFLITLFIGLFLFVNILSPQAQVFTPIIPALGILATMLLAVFALLQRNKRGLWIVGAAMMMGLATKAEAFTSFIHPTDFYQYATSLALWFFGKATQSPTKQSNFLP